MLPSKTRWHHSSLTLPSGAHRHQPGPSLHPQPEGHCTPRPHPRQHSVGPGVTGCMVHGFDQGVSISEAFAFSLQGVHSMWGRKHALSEHKTLLMLRILTLVQLYSAPLTLTNIQTAVFMLLIGLRSGLLAHMLHKLWTIMFKPYAHPTEGLQGLRYSKAADPG